MYRSLVNGNIIYWSYEFINGSNRNDGDDEDDGDDGGGDIGNYCSIAPLDNSERYSIAYSMHWIMLVGHIRNFLMKCENAKRNYN